MPVAPRATRRPRPSSTSTLGNFAEIGLTEVAIVVGYRKEAVYERKAALEQKYGLKLTLIDNDKAEEWNNAYSLWCARDVLKQGVILANGDTVHPVSVEKTLLAARGNGQKIILALDTVKHLADEEMKVVVDPDKGVQQITKLMDPAEATGEYIGVTLIEPRGRRGAGRRAEDHLRARPRTSTTRTATRSSSTAASQIDVAPIGDVKWVEIDNHDDLAKGREIACRY